MLAVALQRNALVGRRHRPPAGQDRRARHEAEELELDHVDGDRIGEHVLEERGRAEEQPPHAPAVLAARGVGAAGGGLAHVGDLRAAKEVGLLRSGEDVGPAPAVLQLADEGGDRAARLVRCLHASIGPLDQLQQP